MLQPLYHPIIQFLYSLQTSQFFPAYTLFVFSLGLLLIYMFVRYLIITHKLSHQVKNPRTTYYSSKLSKREFEKMKLKQTNQQVTSLLNSTAYRSYLVDRHDPHSTINLRSRMLDTQMADEEVLSDEQEQDDRNNMQRQQ